MDELKLRATRSSGMVHLKVASRWAMNMSNAGSSGLQVKAVGWPQAS